MQIMEMAGLNLDEEVRKGSAEDKEQRMLDLNDASLTLTNEIASRWSQKKYEVRFEADGQHFITFVKDVGVPALVPLEERSKGFQWFFSFDMMFMYETKGEFKNTIILLDEPGLHLHAAAQRDLLARMKEYSKQNQLVYSTHLPFMIEFTRLDNIYVAEELPNAGTKVHKNWATADKDSRFTLQAALGLSWSQSLFVGQYNLVVEGVTDFWFLTCVSAIFREAGQDGLDEQLVVTPVGGASKVAYVGTILHGQKLNVAVLLDSDAEGKNAYEQLVKQWILDAKHVLSLNDVIGVSESRTLEDLFDEAYYLNHVITAYQKELRDKPLTLTPGDKRPIVERIEDALKATGIASFNKGRVAKRIMEDLPQKKLTDLSKATVENFKKVIAAINGCVVDWKKKG
jgi:predicted ATP-dependent endonuclease of OLD family